MEDHGGFILTMRNVNKDKEEALNALGAVLY